MTEGSSRAIAAMGAVIAVFLQIIVAPNIAIASALPDFMLAYLVAVSIVSPGSGGCVTAFLLGLVFDLAGATPLGSSSLVYVLATLGVSHAFTVLDADTPFMPVVMTVLSIVLAETVRAVLVIACGLDAGLLAAVVGRALPCALYGCVFGLIAYPLLKRLLLRQGRHSASPLVM